MYMMMGVSITLVSLKDVGPSTMKTSMQETCVVHVEVASVETRIKTRTIGSTQAISSLLKKLRT